MLPSDAPLFSLSMNGNRICYIFAFLATVLLFAALVRDGQSWINTLTGVFSWVTRLLTRKSVLDLASGLVKTSHHCIFDESWYLHSSNRPQPHNCCSTSWDKAYPPLYLNQPCQSRRALLLKFRRMQFVPIFLRDSSFLTQPLSLSGQPLTTQLHAHPLDNPPAQILAEFNIGQRDLAQSTTYAYLPPHLLSLSKKR